MLNNQVTDNIPELEMNGEILPMVSVADYLGDVFNTAENNKDMIDDRIRKGIGNIQEIFALELEITYGVEYIPSLLLLYHKTFLPALTFNSEAWTNMSQADSKKTEFLSYINLLSTYVISVIYNKYIILLTRIYLSFSQILPQHMLKYAYSRTFKGTNFMI